MHGTACCASYFVASISTLLILTFHSQPCSGYPECGSRCSFPWKCFIVLFSLSPGSRGSDSPGPANGDTATEAELELPQVDATVQRLLESGIAPSTTSAYRSAHRRFTSFCSAAELVPFPLKEATVCRFVAHLFQNNLSSGTIQLYLSGLRFYQIASGEDNPFLDSCSRLHYVLHGVARSQPVCSWPTRLPVMTAVLDLLF